MGSQNPTSRYTTSNLRMDKYKMMKEMGGYAQQQFGGGHGSHDPGHGGGSGGGYHSMAHQMGQYGQQMFGHGGHGEHYGGHHGGYHGQMTDKEAMKFAKNKDLNQIDPAVLDYAATRLQAGFRG